MQCSEYPRVAAKPEANMAPKRNQPQADSPCVGDSTLKHHCYEMISKLSKVGSNSRTNKGIEHVLVMSLRGGSLMCRVHIFLLILGFWFMQVLAEELESLKRQRAQMRAASRALAQQEKNVKKRRARLLQAVFFVKRFFIPPWLHLPHEAARQLSQDDLVLLLRQPGGASPTDLDLDLKSSPSILPGGAVPAPPLPPPALAPPVVAGAAAAAPGDLPDDVLAGGTFQPPASSL